ncbi:MAG TPA: molybdopterin molybdotransferase MoeA [Candidatus Azoamicus sp. OHIO2]
MINYFKALSIIFNNMNKHFQIIKIKNNYLSETLYQINSNDIYSDKNIPSFNNSAMDGYAVKQEILTKNIDKNQQITVVEKIKAGDNISTKKFDKNNAVAIMTGAKIPREFDTVIKLEDVKNSDNNYIIPIRHIKKGDNIRFIAEDFKKKDLLIKKCTRLDYNNIITLATCGIIKLNTLTAPNFFLISTGNEISDIKTNFNSECLIYNSSAPYLITLFKSMFFDLIYLGISNDDIYIFLEKLRKMLVVTYINVFITTGAISKGIYDFIPNILKKIGIKIIFHFVNIKPGKPILFAMYKSHVFFFCLPGNIISSIVGFRFFIHPFIKHFFKQDLEKPIKAKLFNDPIKKIKKDTFLKGYCYINNSILKVKILKNQESFKIKPLLNSNCFVFLKKNDIIRKNSLVSIYLYKPSY